jgi:glycosyltransferase involved in cell wall biosynthesis
LLSGLRPPLVSVVIINWNYDKYVGQAIASVRRQTYDNLECIVVDNASTDASVAAINEAIAGDSRFRLRQMPENLGHLGAALATFDELRGDFVNFLDADDILFENFLASHIQVHLATEASVSFTSSDVVTIDGENALLGGGIDYINEMARELPKCLPPSPQFLLPQITIADYEHLRVVTVDPPADIGGWRWAPGSSNVLRRALMVLLRPDTPNAPILGGVDAYFLYPLFGLTGVNLIAAPLSAYRVHGSNDFARLPHLRGIRGGNEKAHRRNSAVGRMLLLTMIEKCGELVERASPAARYFTILDLIAKNQTDAVYDGRQRVFADPEIVAALARKYFQLVGIFGERRLVSELRAIMKAGEVAAVLSAAYKDRIPFATLRRAASVEWRARRAALALRRSERARARAAKAAAKAT